VSYLNLCESVAKFWLPNEKTAESGGF